MIIVVVVVFIIMSNNLVYNNNSIVVTITGFLALGQRIAKEERNWKAIEKMQTTQELEERTGWSVWGGNRKKRCGQGRVRVGQGRVGLVGTRAEEKEEWCSCLRQGWSVTREQQCPAGIGSQLLESLFCPFERDYTIHPSPHPFPSCSFSFSIIFLFIPSHCPLSLSLWFSSSSSSFLAYFVLLFLCILYKACILIYVSLFTTKAIHVTVMATFEGNICLSGWTMASIILLLLLLFFKFIAVTVSITAMRILEGSFTDSTPPGLLAPKSPINVILS